MNQLTTFIALWHTNLKHKSTRFYLESWKLPKIIIKPCCHDGAHQIKEVIESNLKENNQKPIVFDFNILMNFNLIIHCIFIETNVKGFYQYIYFIMIER